MSMLEKKNIYIYTYIYIYITTNENQLIQLF